MSKLISVRQRLYLRIPIRISACTYVIIHGPEYLGHVFHVYPTPKLSLAQLPLLALIACLRRAKHYIGVDARNNSSPFGRIGFRKLSLAFCFQCCGGAGCVDFAFGDQLSPPLVPTTMFTDIALTVLRFLFHVFDCKCKRAARCASPPKCFLYCQFH